MRQILASRVILLNSENKVLLVRRGETAPTRAFDWELPGGMVENGEDPRVGGLRELKEEVGINLSNVDYLYATNSENNLFVFFNFYQKVENPQVTLSYEHDMFDWISIEDAINMVTLDDIKQSLDILRNYILEKNYSIRISTKAILKNQDGKVLILQRSINDRLGPGNWDLPGGGIEQSESLSDALERELKEETGLLPAEQKVVFAKTVTRDEAQQVQIRIGQLSKSDNDNIELSHEHDDFRWVEPSELSAMIPEPNWSSFAKNFAIE